MSATLTSILPPDKNHKFKNKEAKSYVYKLPYYV